jgi:iron(III) transport system ATP-binding protein
MSEGRIQQIGRPRDIYERPVNQFVADFVGTTNFIEGTVLGPELTTKGFYLMRTEIGDITVAAVEDLRSDERVVLSVRPEDVELAEARPEGGNVWQGCVDQKVFLGEALDFRVTVGTRTLLSRRHPRLRTPVGHSIFVQLNPEKCVALKIA